jgi:hypothetical protein
MFALLIPMLLAMSGFVIGIGNWFVHAKNLQAKADAGALAGGTAWEFPCGTPGINAIDQRIADVARQYAGPSTAPPVASPGTGYNPQVGGVGSPKIHTVLNGPNWYDDDANQAPTENLDICETMRLNVKVTEDNTFPLASLIPLFPDLKRQATVKLVQGEGVAGLLPIAVRAPEPASMMAIFYNEGTGTILARKYFVKKDLSAAGLPGGVQGWSTENTLYANDQQGWARVNLQSPNTGVVVAISFRGACNTWVPTSSGGPGPPPNVTVEPSGPCFEDGLGLATGEPNYTNIGTLCNQGGAVQIANCYYATGTFPSEQVQSGLHFIRSFNPATVSNNGPPELNNAYLTPSTCSGSGYGTGYFTTFPNTCTANLSVDIDAGSCPRVNGTGPCDFTNPAAVESRTAANIEVKYIVVSGTGNNDDTCTFGNSCDLSDSGQAAGYSANGQIILDPTGRTQYAIGLRIRMKNTIAPNRTCDNNGFGGSCEWYFRGIGRVDTQPSNAVFFNDPVQRAFRGNTVNAASIKWLKLRADKNPCPAAPGVPASETSVGSNYSGLEGSLPSGISCFVVDVGLKGGIATDADNDSTVWNDGVGSSQLGYLDCTQTGPQNIVFEIMNGCPPLYAPNTFTTNPYCPPANDLFQTPYPGYPSPTFGNGDWPPLRCVKTRTTSQGSDLVKGLNGRFFFPNDPSPPPNPPNTCPSQNGNLYTQGRNYWKHVSGGPPFGYYENDGSWETHFDPKDSRLVTIFLTTSESFTGSGQDTFPVVGAIAVYITGFGRVGGNGSITVDDPCAGPLPSDLDLSGGSSGGRVVWGHLVNHAVLSANATPSGKDCNPGGSSQVCVAVLVE